MALCQILPGPASSQLGHRDRDAAGRDGSAASAAWLGFTLPSAVALTVLGLVAASTDLSGAGWVHGLKVAAVAVVAQAVWVMAGSADAGLAAAGGRARRGRGGAGLGDAVRAGRDHRRGRGRRPLAAGAAARDARHARRNRARCRVGSGSPALALLRWCCCSALPLLRAADGQPVAMFDAFFRSGALVFGGGHVVLPLLHSTVVEPGWVTESQFLAGYGAAQAVPGPLFTFAAYLGAVSAPAPNGVPGAALATVAIFLPSFLLIFGALPFWDWLRGSVGVRRALAGINAAVVGILLAALYTPVWTGAITGADRRRGRRQRRSGCC